jgi:hypothetical protein
MKKITLLIALAISFVGFSQQEVVQDFENSPSIAGFEGLASATIVPDPSTAGNGQVLELVTSATGNPWQGAEVVLADDSVLDLTSDITVSVDVWSTVAFSPMFKVETTGSATAAPFSANTQSHTGSGWETLTYTFNTGDDGTATANGLYNKVVFFPNRSSDGTAWNTPVDGTFYFDNITGVKGSIASGPTGNPPTTAAPTPPAAPDNQIISIYSDAYAQQPLNFDAGFCGTGSVEEIQVAGNNTILYKGNACQGIQLNTPVDASSFTTFNFDFYIDVAVTDFVGKVVSLKLVDTNGADPDDVIDIVLTDASTPVLVAGQWVTLSVPVDLSLFDTFDEFVITAGTLSNQFYYDNVYLSGGTLSNDEFDVATFSVYPNPTSNVWNIDTNNTNIQTVEIFNTLGRLVKSIEVNASEISIDANDFASGIYFAKINSQNSNSNTVKLIKK